MNRVLQCDHNNARAHLVKEIVEPYIVSVNRTSIHVRNAEGFLVHIDFSADPDIAIRTQSETGAFINETAIEIKGGRDISNVHNRIGEAEKSHQKARNRGFKRFITIVNVSKLDMEIAKEESPTTDRFYLIQEIKDEGKENYADFKKVLLTAISVARASDHV